MGFNAKIKNALNDIYFIANSGDAITTLSLSLLAESALNCTVDFRDPSVYILLRPHLLRSRKGPMFALFHVIMGPQPSINLLRAQLAVQSRQDLVRPFSHKIGIDSEIGIRIELEVHCSHPAVNDDMNDGGALPSKWIWPTLELSRHNLFQKSCGSIQRATDVWVLVIPGEADDSAVVGFDRSLQPIFFIVARPAWIAIVDGMLQDATVVVWIKELIYNQHAVVKVMLGPTHRHH